MVAGEPSLDNLNRFCDSSREKKREKGVHRNNQVYRMGIENVSRDTNVSIKYIVRPAEGRSLIIIVIVEIEIVNHHRDHQSLLH